MFYQSICRNLLAHINNNMKTLDWILSSYFFWRVTIMTYKKLTETEITEIRRRYELGENLKDLAIEFNVNYNTLKNRASRESWAKGKPIKTKEDYSIEIRVVQNKHKNLVNKLFTEYERAKTLDEITIVNIKSEALERLINIENKVLGVVKNGLEK